MGNESPRRARGKPCDKSGAEEALWRCGKDSIDPQKFAANFAWGDEDGKTLYLTARTALYKMRLKIAGVRP